jgi:hypothetical protein
MAGILGLSMSRLFVLQQGSGALGDLRNITQVITWRPVMMAVVSPAELMAPSCGATLRSMSGVWPSARERREA